MRTKPKTTEFTQELPEWLSFKVHPVNRGTAEIRETAPYWAFDGAPWAEHYTYNNGCFESLWKGICALRNAQSTANHEEGRRVLVWHTDQFDVESFKRYARDRSVPEAKFTTIWSIT